MLASVLPVVVAAETHTVAIDGMKFQPETVIVKPGDTVVWRNSDVVPHTATAAKRFDSGRIAAGASWSWTAKGKGRLEYVCTYHPGMKAAVVVQ
jgi:plastocyanin